MHDLSTFVHIFFKCTFPPPLPCSQNPLLFPVLNQLNPVHAFTSYFSKIHFDIISNLVLVSQLVSPPAVFWQNFLRISYLPIRATCLQISTNFI
jgi:hypothetical protein